ncbi:MAG: BBP7 family outer membrane beta-barrel protein [Planctomycetales bacterium]|nr:BBP7 family outer membrane beta-barrel protein [Planctomycetales bacterium]
MRKSALVLMVCVFIHSHLAAQDPRERSVKVPSRGNPRVAQNTEPIDAAIVEGEEFAYEYEPSGHDERCGLDCVRCGGFGCDLLWLRAEYLMYWADGMNVPPLVTGSPNGTLVGDAGVLGLPSTTILYGGGGILEDLRNGARFTAGKWLDCCHQAGIEFEYFFLPEINERFQASGFGDPIIMRPFFNAVTNQEDAEIVSFPGELGGTVTVRSKSDIQGGGVRLLYKLTDNVHCGDVGCGHLSCGAARTRFNLLAGYRYIGLDENLSINEDLVSLDPQAAGTFNVNDIFDTDNDFHGGELGLQWTMNRNRWELNLLAKVALGNNHERVRIRGFTVITPDGQPSTTEVGGLLAQTSNIGDYSRDEFAVVSEYGATLKCHVTPRFLVSAGYTMIFWNDVVRPGDQIDLRVNPNLIPPPDLAAGGPALPAFPFRETDFWLQGLRLGGEFRW